MTAPEEFQADPPPERPPAHAEPRPRRREYDDEDFRRRPSEGEEVASTIIPYKNPKALAAYYCGVFGLIPCVGAILGPIALILGILGLRYVKVNPTAKGTGHAIAGVVLGIIALYNWVFIILGVVGMVMVSLQK